LAKLLYREVFDDRWRRELEDSFQNHRPSYSGIEYGESAVRSLLHSSGSANCLFPEFGDIGERKYPFGIGEVFAHDLSGI
jgi:hypothetical protein